MYQNLLEIMRIKKPYREVDRRKVIEEYTELVGLSKIYWRDM